MTQHIQMVNFVEHLRTLNKPYAIVTLDGWDTAQGDYLWTRPGGAQAYHNPPLGAILHGTAGSISRPVVRDDRGRWSVANAWTGLSDDGGNTLTTAGAGVPTIVFTSAGPARYSSGYGVASVLADISDDEAPRTDADEADGDTAANRYLFSIENTHPNDGSPIDQGVYDMLVDVFIEMHRYFDWQDRGIMHRTWTKRKPVDPWFPEWDSLWDDVVAGVGDDACPWNPPCQKHFDIPSVAGSKGVCNVPSYAEGAITRQAERGVIKTTDGSRDDFSRNLTDGRYWVFDDRGRNIP